MPGHGLPVHDSRLSCHFLVTALFSIEESIEQLADQQTAAQWRKAARTIIRNSAARVRRLLTAMGKCTFFKQVADEYYHSGNQYGYQDALFHG